MSRAPGKIFLAVPNKDRVVTHVDHNVHTLRDPKRKSMKLTSQIRSLTCFAPSFGSKVVCSASTARSDVRR